jgi:FtsP/CotA-like multicopper oxidase with cupredoxin domain
MNNPGVWILGSPRDDERAKGLGIVVEYENQKGEPQWKAPANTPWDYTLFGDSTPAAPRQVERTFDLSFHMLADDGHAFNRWVVNEQSWPKVDPLVVKDGRRYRLVFHSGHEDGHPLHLHRHLFELVKVGTKATSGIWKGHRPRAARRHGGSGVPGRQPGALPAPLPHAAPHGLRLQNTGEVRLTGSI